MSSLTGKRHLLTIWHKYLPHLPDGIHIAFVLIGFVLCLTIEPHVSKVREFDYWFLNYNYYDY